MAYKVSSGIRGGSQSPTSTNLETDKSLAGLEASAQDSKLSGQLLALGSIILRFAGETGNLLLGHGEDADRREDLVQLGNQFRLDNLHGNVINESLERNLQKRGEKFQYLKDSSCYGVVWEMCTDLVVGVQTI